MLCMHRLKPKKDPDGFQSIVRKRALDRIDAFFRPQTVPITINKSQQARLD
jgi:hypothetical protein